MVREHSVYFCVQRLYDAQAVLSAYKKCYGMAQMEKLFPFEGTLYYYYLR
jgi:hypothetical protein